MLEKTSFNEFNGKAITITLFGKKNEWDALGIYES